MHYYNQNTRAILNRKTPLHPTFNTRRFLGRARIHHYGHNTRTFLHRSWSFPRALDTRPSSYSIPRQIMDGVCKTTDRRWWKEATVYQVRTGVPFQVKTSA